MFDPMANFFRFGGSSSLFSRDRPGISKELRALIQKEFDPKFFVAAYKDLFPNLGTHPASKAIDIYLDNALDKRLDPCEGFSEERYVNSYDDVRAAISRGEFISGFHHWLVHGSREGRPVFSSAKASSAAESLSELKLNVQDLSVFGRLPMARWEKHIDRGWYSDWLKDRYNEHVPETKVVEHFLKVGLWRGDIPSPSFDEDFYLQYYEDIFRAKQKRTLPSGYAHFVLNGENEGRLPRHDLKLCLAHKLGALAVPSGLQHETALASKFRPVLFQSNPAKPPTLNVFVPSLDPDIMFGGYIAFLQFLCRVAEQGTPLRFIVTEDGQSNRRWFSEKIRERWRTAFAESEFLNASQLDQPVISGNRSDICIAYSAWTAYAASAYAKNLHNKKIIYFIQEDERVFHENNSLHFFVSGAYDINHAAIFNTVALENYFRELRVGVFAHETSQQNFLTFEHAITNVRPNIDAMRNKGHKKLFVYCRPEGHAGRNLFEVCVMTLRRCVEKKILDSSWEMIGLGSMGYEGEIDLGGGVELLIRSRVDQAEYEGLIQSFDVGLSLMWAPHPSVIPYELAGAGVVCVTNTFGYRNKAYFEDFGFNIVATNPSIEDLSEGVREAVRRSDDFDQRIKSAKISFPTNWDTVFTPQFVKAALSLLENS